MHSRNRSSLFSYCVAVFTFFLYEEQHTRYLTSIFNRGPSRIGHFFLLALSLFLLLHLGFHLDNSWPMIFAWPFFYDLKFVLCIKIARDFFFIRNHN